jgi:hypothetical protein
VSTKPGAHYYIAVKFGCSTLPEPAIMSNASHPDFSQRIALRTLLTHSPSFSAFRMGDDEEIPHKMDRLCGLVVRVPDYRSRGPGLDSRRCQIFWDVGDLERGPFSLVRISEELLQCKSSGSGSRKIKINGRGDPLRWPRNTLYLQKLALTSPTSGGRSVGIVCLRTKATEFS